MAKVFLLVVFDRKKEKSGKFYRVEKLSPLLTWNSLLSLSTEYKIVCEIEKEDFKRKRKEITVIFIFDERDTNKMNFEHLLKLSQKYKTQ